MLQPVLKALLRLMFRLVFRVRVHGNPDIRADRLLIVANHESFLDELLLGLFLPQRPVIVVYASATHNRLFRFFALGLVDYLAIDPNNPLELKAVIRLLETGRPVLIFPEGRVTTTGNLMKTYDGPGFIAAKAGATILPVRIEGAARSHFSLVKGRFPRTLFPRIRLFVQEPTRIENEKVSHSEQHHLAAESMHRVMTGLMFAGRSEQTLYAALLEAARLQGRNWRFLGDVERVDYSYNDLLRSALIFGRKLDARLAKDERAGLLLPNSASLLALLFGLSAFRHPPVLLNPAADCELLRTGAAGAGLRTIITTRSLTTQPGFAAKLAALGGIELILIEDLHETVSLGDHLWWLLWAKARARHVVPQGRPEDPALVMFTAGSGSRCKGVVLSHRAILSNVSQLRSVLDFSSNDVIINALPLNSPFGLTCGALIPLLCGARLFLYPSAQHYRVIPEMSYTAPCSILFGSNTFLAHYGENARPFDLHGLRYVIAGTAPVSDTVRQLWFEKFGVRIFEGYGTAETAPVISINTPMACRLGSVGQFLPSLRHRLMPLAGVVPIHGGRCGQLHVAGPNLMDGYLAGMDTPPAATAIPDEAGWHDTGDIVEIDPDGFVYLRGRARLELRLGDSQVCLGVLEMILDENRPAGRHAVVSDEATPPSLTVFSTDPMLDHEAAMAHFGAAGLTPPPEAIKVVTIDEIPLETASNKPDYGILRRNTELINGQTSHSG
ncbi:AMP-binding protein [Uliginosibacterium paludis]|uniref:AMP-binding protein n=1 Tax=Uliginosibacterium paludis TaxID=1615952 RepID=A0ABV2CNQ8_9RHOO